MVTTSPGEATSRSARATEALAEVSGPPKGACLPSSGVRASVHPPEPAALPRYILAPFVPTPPEVVERMLDLARVSEQDLVYDLGCGDGRIVIAAARRGARGFGVDIEPYWVAKSRANAAQAGVEHLVSFALQDALTVDLAPATVVMLYLVQWSTEKLQPLLAAGLRKGSRIVSHSFPMGGRPADQLERWIDGGGQARTLYLWLA